MAHYTCNTYVTLSHPHSVTTSIYAIIYNPQRLLALLNIPRGVANSYQHLHSDILVIVSGHFCDRPGTQLSIPLYYETQALSTEEKKKCSSGTRRHSNKRRRKQRGRPTTRIYAAKHKETQALSTENCLLQLQEDIIIKDGSKEDRQQGSIRLNAMKQANTSAFDKEEDGQSKEEDRQEGANVK